MCWRKTRFCAETAQNHHARPHILALRACEFCSDRQCTDRSGRPRPWAAAIRPSTSASRKTVGLRERYEGVARAYRDWRVDYPGWCERRPRAATGTTLLADSANAAARRAETVHASICRAPARDATTFGASLFEECARRSVARPCVCIACSRHAKPADAHYRDAAVRHPRTAVAALGSTPALTANRSLRTGDGTRRVRLPGCRPQRRGTRRGGQKGSG